jgi:hypothetical protein
MPGTVTNSSAAPSPSPSLTASAVLLSLTVSCASLGGGIADVVATVKGTIEKTERGKEGEGTPTCRLDLFRDGKADPVRSTRVEGQFRQNYGLAPGRYYFEIVCGHSAPAFRSAVYEIKDMRYHRTPIDLGVVTAR